MDENGVLCPSLSITSLSFPGLQYAYMDINGIIYPALSIPELQYTHIDINNMLCSTIDFNTIAIPGLQFTFLNIVELNFDVLQALGIILPVVDSSGTSVVVLKIKDEKLIKLIELWEKRYSYMPLDFFDNKGNKIVPQYGSVLWHKRKAVIAAAESSENYARLWKEYNQQMQTAIGRRMVLKKKR